MHLIRSKKLRTGELREEKIGKFQTTILESVRNKSKQGCNLLYLSVQKLSLELQVSPLD